MMTTMELQRQPTLITEAPTHCATHPAVETMLRCNKCDQFICLKCAVLTPVGYRCKNCVRSQQAVYFNAYSWDNPLVFVTSLLVVAFTTPITGLLSASFFFGAFYLAFLAGPSAGMLLAQLIRWVVGRRRSRQTAIFAAAGMVAGVIIGGALAWQFSGLLLWYELPVWIVAFLALTTAYRALR
jgi:hypothetical protein